MKCPLSSSTKDIVLKAGITLLYFGLAVVSLEFATIEGHVTVIWIPAGFSLAILLKFGYKYVPSIFFGALMAGLYVGNTILISALIAAGNTLEPIFVIYLLNQFPFSKTLYRIKDYISLIFAGCIGATISAIIGVTSLILAGYISIAGALPAIAPWWMGDALGIILITPFLLLFNSGSLYALIRGARAETLFLFITSTIIPLAIFTNWGQGELKFLSGSYLLVIPLVWSALRFSQALTSMVVFEYFLIAVWGLLTQQGLFVDAISLAPDYPFFWLYFVVLSIASLLVAYSVNEKNTLYQAINSSKTETYVFCEDDLRFEFVNQAALENLGITLSEALKLTPLDIKPLYSNKEFFKLLLPLLRKEVTHLDFETVHQRKDGSVYPVEINIQLVSHSNRRCYIASVIDITSRQERDAHRILGNHVSDISPQAIMITDKDNNIVRINKAFTKLTGYEESDVIGENPHILSSGRHDASFYENLWNTLNCEGYWQGEIYNRKKCGELYLQDLTISLLHNALGDVIHHIGMFTDITLERERVMSLKHLSEHDVLTGLPNRSKLQQEFEFAVASTKRSQNKLAMLYLDLNKFKSINDNYGHTCGDGVLREIAERIDSGIRETDMASRIGGDEFVVLVTNIESDMAIGTLISKLKNIIIRPINIDGIEFIVPASIGVAIYPENGDTLDDLLKASDESMFEDKKKMKSLS